MSQSQASAFARAVDLPQTMPAALLRGVKGKCPRCGEAKLFRAYLKPIDACPACGQDWTPQCADDFPAYISILVSGHLMAPVIVALVLAPALPAWLAGAIIVAFALVLTVSLLQPAKGAVIAGQWWLGMHGFKPDRLKTSLNDT